jgi:hypothetical protein
MDWKHLLGGDQHKKDFTVYLGSYATMMVFVNNLENDPIVKQLSDFNGGSADTLGSMVPASTHATGLAGFGCTAGTASRLRSKARVW